MVSLLEILKENDKVLFDGSAKSVHRIVEETKYKVHLDPQDIDVALCESKDIERSTLALRHSKVGTIIEVVKEIERYEELVRNKIQQMHEVESASDEFPILVMETVADKVRALKNQAKQSCLKSPYSDPLYKIIRLLDEELNLTSPRETSRRYPDLKTDLKLTAMAYSLTMQGYQVCILTRDLKHFGQLLTLIPQNLGASEFVPLNQLYRDTLTAKPVRVYETKTNSYDLMISRNDIAYSETFKLPNTQPARQKTLKDKIRLFLHELDSIETEESSKVHD